MIFCLAPMWQLMIHVTVIQMLSKMINSVWRYCEDCSGKELNLDRSFLQPRRVALMPEPLHPLYPQSPIPIPHPLVPRLRSHSGCVAGTGVWQGRGFNVPRSVGRNRLFGGENHSEFGT